MPLILIWTVGFLTRRNTRRIKWTRFRTPSLLGRRRPIYTGKSWIRATTYSKLVTRRGFTYSYYFSPAAEGKPVLFFVHGFLSGSYL
ncbi:hypothetical protein C8J56DRAFT_801174 [Mycena floridula]|nr:hypothetical protein C8J56DRAFT_801174 [Mycena floridula]